MNIPESMTWIGNWAWGVPLIIVNVLMHVVGLNLVGQFVLGDYASALRKGSAALEFVVVVATTALFMISLHAIEAMTWAGVETGCTNPTTMPAGGAIANASQR